MAITTVDGPLAMFNIAPYAATVIIFAIGYFFIYPFVWYLRDAKGPSSIHICGNILWKLT